MLNNVTIGQFFPGDSFLYHLDPRTKLLLTLALLFEPIEQGQVWF